MFLDDLVDVPNPQFAWPHRSDPNASRRFAFDASDRGLDDA